MLLSQYKTYIKYQKPQQDENKMEIGITSHTGHYDYMEKLYRINHQFGATYCKTLRHKQYGGIITGTIIVPISVYEEGEDQKNYKKKYLERQKNWDGIWESSIIFNLFINPLVVQRLTMDELDQLYCDSIIAQFNDSNFKLPKNFDSHTFKKDFIEIIEDFRIQKIKFEP